MTPPTDDLIIIYSRKNLLLFFSVKVNFFSFRVAGFELNHQIEVNAPKQASY